MQWQSLSLVLSRKSQTRFCWTPEDDRAFMELKGRFISGPIFVHPDPTRPCDGGGRLGQRNEEDKKCTFLSKRFLPSERSYNVGKWELLAVKWALEGWEHWLEGVPHPFIIWMDYKNFVSIQEAKRLNTHQAGSVF